MGEEEIARIEGVSHQAVHENLSSAVRLLREFVEGRIYGLKNKWTLL